jgi:glycosyltransferase involved in cell wall biosynthesis
MSRRILVATTAHWEGDPRLNRHKTYLERVGHNVAIRSFATEGRTRGTVSAARAILRERPNVVILPDPELFFIGSIVARLAGSIAIIDIHEDYPRVATGRRWVPDRLTWLVSLLARAAVSLGRLAAHKVIVAAPELARQGDGVVLNIPDPTEFAPVSSPPSRMLVYVGDITAPRGAVEMVEVLGHLDDRYELLLIGRVDESTRFLIDAAAVQHSVQDRVILTGRLDHGEAWARARGSLVGLSLLQDLPAYRQAVATKLWEYMASGIPPVVSDLPGQRELVSQLSDELVCATPLEAAAAIESLAADQERWRSLSSAGRALLDERWDENRPDLVVQSIVDP